MNEAATQAEMDAWSRGYTAASVEYIGRLVPEQEARAELEVRVASLLSENAVLKAAGHRLTTYVTHDEAMDLLHCADGCECGRDSALAVWDAAVNP